MKGQEKPKKLAKKVPQKSLKEKRSEKRAKKRGSTFYAVKLKGGATAGSAGAPRTWIRTAPITIAPPTSVAVAGPLRERDPHPERAEHDLEQRDQRDLGGRNQARAQREEDQAEADLGDSEPGQEREVTAADLARVGKRRGEEQHQHLREAGRRRHRDLAPVPRDHDHGGERDGHQQREAHAGQARVVRASDHQPDPEHAQPSSRPTCGARPARRRRCRARRPGPAPAPA